VIDKVVLVVDYASCVLDLYPICIVFSFHIYKLFC
jgi:hypothetical protein